MATLRACTLFALLFCPGCATILGTAASPVTGGVDLVVQTQSPKTWYLWVPVFLGGAVTGPFVAFYNGVNRDAQIFNAWNGYWRHFDDVFRPWELIGVN